MFHVNKINKSKDIKFLGKGLSVLILSSCMSACILEGDGDDPAPTEAQVNFILASVDGGSCSLLDPYANMTLIAGPTDTAQGLGTFENVAPDTGLAVVECSGGTYIDEATGNELSPGTLRSYVDITSSEFSVTVSPLTEIAARLVDYYELAPEDYAGVLSNVAYSVGLKDIDVAKVVPLDLNVDYMDGTEQGNYGLVLAALSQMQLDFDVDNADFIMNELFVGMANNGLFTSEEIREWYFEALDNMFFNPRIDPYLGSDENLDKFFHDVVLAPVASQVEYVDADHPDSHNVEALTVIDGFKTSVFDIVGTHLSLKMDVTLGDEQCRLRDLQKLADTNSDIREDLMFAECPAQGLGEVDLVIKDSDGRVENITTMTVVEPGSFDYRIGREKRVEADSRNATSSANTGTSYVYGYVSAEAPFIDASVSAAHDYRSSKITKFDVAGVTVELIDEAKQVIARTTTFNDGYYEFSTAPESTSVRVVVKAEIKKEREAGTTTGPEYNFSVRDNTSSTIPKKMYEVVTPYFTTLAAAGSDNPMDIVAKVGFDDSGKVTSEAQRQSAPFSILRSMKAASEQLVNINADLTLPTLNVYWSGKNIGVDGDKNIGEISTSHYTGSGLLPGLFILGKADSDTDEFDQGVIGHEFGHYLQDQLSYDDSPGGSHSSVGNYKDASLSYGEGYGTAIGGLLAQSQYYCDVSGDAQTGGFCQNLANKSLAGDINGFYSEASIITLMYAIGQLPNKGTAEVFKAVTKMRQEMHSATIFSFLHHYLAANPDVRSEVEALMVEHNVKSSDPFGVLPANAVIDDAISAANNKGDAQTGADDLDKLYINLELESIIAPSGDASPALLTPNSTPFCVNRNLVGSNSHNGLGMRRRFTFTANYTGDILVAAKNKFNHVVNDNEANFEMRDEDGNKRGAYNYTGTDKENYFGIFEVVSGKKYSLKFNMHNPESVLNGSQCGFKVELSRPAF